MREKTGNLLLHNLLLSLLIVIICVPMLMSGLVYAEPTYSSTNYGVDEVFMGSGGLNDASSDNYWARASLGDTAVGNSSSNNYQLYGGFTTTEEPYLECTVNASTIDLGVQSTGSASTGSGTFTVRAYLANGYVVRTAEDPPQNNTYTMIGLTNPTQSVPGTEQFGINLVSNSQPASVGANPAQLPSPVFSYGYAATGYDTPNYYKYVKGDIIARSDSSSGSTLYTISYMMNVNSTTPSGLYKMDHSIVVTATF